MVYASLVRVLVVEDNQKLGSVLRRLFDDEAMPHTIVTSAHAALEALSASAYDVLVLDWMLPDMDGVTLCAELRRSGSRVPILMLTARGELRDKIVGFESGVDDYLVKPFDVEELLLRLRALVRRSPVAKSNLGDLAIDRLSRRATLAGQPLDLTARELALLLYLVDAEGRTVSKAEILEKVWDLTFDPGTNVIEVLISRLRDKLGERSSLIETVRGAGYRFRTS
jgi:DNA-binding response OmpR family regulator